MSAREETLGLESHANQDLDDAFEIEHDGSKEGLHGETHLADIAEAA